MFCETRLLKEEIEKLSQEIRSTPPRRETT